MGQKVIIRFEGISVIVCLKKPSHHFLQAFRPLRTHMFCDSSLYPKQLPLFCLLRLISPNADRIGYSTNFCSMKNCCTSSKTAVVNTKAFRHLIMSQHGKRKTKRLLDFQARNQLWTPGVSKSFLGAGQFFKTMSNSFKIRPTHFSCGDENFSRGGFVHLWLRTCGLPYITNNKRFLAYFMRILSSCVV